MFRAALCRVIPEHILVHAVFKLFVFLGQHKLAYFKLLLCLSELRNLRI
jgi:hypothetical protein